MIAKLERLSADSAWAHRASGARGGLLRLVESLEAGDGREEDLYRLESLIEWAYVLLERAARELIE